VDEETGRVYHYDLSLMVSNWTAHDDQLDVVISGVACPDKDKSPCDGTLACTDDGFDMGRLISYKEITGKYLEV
jgi:hypothetical protein